MSMNLSQKKNKKLKNLGMDMSLENIKNCKNENKVFLISISMILRK